TLLNDPEFVEAARIFATRVVGSATKDSARLELAYQLALGRSINPAERDSLLRFLKSATEEYRARPEDVKKLLAVGFSPPNEDNAAMAGWVSVCRVILNLHETITRY